jgi:hypothetical protein
VLIQCRVRPPEAEEQFRCETGGTRKMRVIRKLIYAAYDR